MITPETTPTLIPTNPATAPRKQSKDIARDLRAGVTNTGNVTATVGNKLVLNWHGTPIQRDGVLQMFPVIRDKTMPGLELGVCADGIIASIHDGGMSPDNDGSNIQTIAMLWRVFTTRLDGVGTYGDLIAYANLHAAFELHEQINDQFRITWKISAMGGESYDCDLLMLLTLPPIIDVDARVPIRPITERPSFPSPSPWRERGATSARAGTLDWTGL